MANRRAHRFSKKFIGGSIFVATSFIGGFLTSFGASVYTLMQGAFSTAHEFLLSLLQIAFLLIGVIGLVLVLADLQVRKPSSNRRRN